MTKVSLVNEVHSTDHSWSLFKILKKHAESWSNLFVTTDKQTKLNQQIDKSDRRNIEEKKEIVLLVVLNQIERNGVKTAPIEVLFIRKKK